MIHISSIKVNVIKCECGRHILKQEDKSYYTCNDCGTSLSHNGKVLVKGQRKVLV